MIVRGSVRGLPGGLASAALCCAPLVAPVTRGHVGTTNEPLDVLTFEQSQGETLYHVPVLLAFHFEAPTLEERFYEAACAETGKAVLAIDDAGARRRAEREALVHARANGIGQTDTWHEARGMLQIALASIAGFLLFGVPG